MDLVVNSGNSINTNAHTYTPKAQPSIASEYTWILLKRPYRGATKRKRVAEVLNRGSFRAA